MNDLRMIQVGPGRWVNPRYVVAAVLHEDTDRTRTLTLTLDASTGVPEACPDVRGLWIGSVMQALDLDAGSGLAQEAK